MGKKRILAMLCWSFVAVKVLGGNEYRTFSSAGGQSVQAKIVEYNSDKKQVRIERRNGKRVWVDPVVFSEKDQGYVKEWIAADKVLSSKALQVSIKKKNIQARGNSDGVYYEIVLRNRSGEPMDGLKIEYKYFLRLIADKVSDPNRMGSGEIDVGKIEDGRRKTLITEDIREFKEYEKQRSAEIYYDAQGNSMSSKNRVKIGECALEGIWFRIHGPSVEGVPMHRDICRPEHLPETVAWNEEYPPLEAGFSFLNMKPKKDITSLEEARERGKAENQTDYKIWMRQARDQLKLDLSKDEFRQVMEGIKIFYNPNFDPRGYDARSLGDACRKRKFHLDEVFWFETGLAAGNRHFLLDLVKLYSSSKNPEVQNGPKAVNYAKEALKEDKKNPELLDLLARAYARNGEFNLAVDTQKYAIERFLKTCRSQPGIEAYEKRMELYEKRKPFPR